MPRYRGSESPMSDDTDELYTDLSSIGSQLHSILNSGKSNKMSDGVRHTYDYDTRGRSTVNLLSSPSHSTSSLSRSLPGSPERGLRSFAGQTTRLNSSWGSEDEYNTHSYSPRYSSSTPRSARSRQRTPIKGGSATVSHIPLLSSPPSALSSPRVKFDSSVSYRPRSISASDSYRSRSEESLNHSFSGAGRSYRSAFSDDDLADLADQTLSSVLPGSLNTSRRSPTRQYSQYSAVNSRHKDSPGRASCLRNSNSSLGSRSNGVHGSNNSLDNSMRSLDYSMHSPDSSMRSYDSHLSRPQTNSHIPVPQRSAGMPEHQQRRGLNDEETDASLKGNLSSSAHATLAMFEQAGGPLKSETGKSGGLMVASGVYGKQGHLIKQTTTTLGGANNDLNQEQRATTTIITQHQPDSPDGARVMHTIQHPGASSVAALATTQHPRADIQQQQQQQQHPSQVLQQMVPGQQQVVHQAVATSTTAATTTMEGQAVVGQVTTQQSSIERHVVAQPVSHGQPQNQGNTHTNLQSNPQSPHYNNTQRQSSPQQGSAQHHVMAPQPSQQPSQQCTAQPFPVAGGIPPQVSPPQYNGQVHVQPSPPQMHQPIQQTTGQPMQQPMQPPIQQPHVQPTQQHIGQAIVIEHQHPLATTPQHLHRGVSQEPASISLPNSPQRMPSADVHLGNQSLILDSTGAVQPAMQPNARVQTSGAQPGGAQPVGVQLGGAQPGLQSNMVQDANLRGSVEMLDDSQALVSSGTTQQTSVVHSSPNVTVLHTTENNDGSISSMDIRSMENVRGQLQTMMQTTANNIRERTNINVAPMQPNSPHSANASLLQPLDSQVMGSHYDSLMQMANLLQSGDLTAMTGTSVQRTDNSTLMASNQLLTQNIEKEKYKRKHLEGEVKELQTKLLEVQQQYAVALSTDRKKDSMIEHLDKALAKVVDSWKTRESEKEALINQLREQSEKMSKRNELLEEKTQKQEREIKELTEQRDVAVKRAEKSECDKEIQCTEQEKERSRTLALLEQEQQQLHAMISDRDEARHQRDHMQHTLETVKQQLHMECETFNTKEREYLQKIDEITEDHVMTVEKERSKYNEQSQLSQEYQQVLQSTQQELHNVADKLEDAIREKESLKVQMGIQEAKHETVQKSLEIDLKAEMEKQLSSTKEQCSSKQQSAEQTLREQHRAQVLQMTAEHRAEMDQLKKHLAAEMKKKIAAFTEQAKVLQGKLDHRHREAEKNKGYLKKLEGQRVDMTAKLQSMMQSHCNETLRLLNIGSAPNSPEALKKYSSTPHLASDLQSSTLFMRHSKAIDDTPLTSPSKPSINSKSSPFLDDRFNDVQTSQSNERTEAISSTEPSIEISTEDSTDNTLNITDLLSITESTIADITKPSAGEPLSLPNSLEQPSDALLTTPLIDLASTVPTPQTSMSVINMSSSMFDTPRDPFSPMRLVVKYKQKELHDAMESQSEESHSRVIANDSKSVSLLLPELSTSQPESMMSSSNIVKGIPSTPSDYLQAKSTQNTTVHHNGSLVEDATHVLQTSRHISESIDRVKQLSTRPLHELEQMYGMQNGMNDSISSVGQDSVGSGHQSIGPGPASQQANRLPELFDVLTSANPTSTTRTTAVPLEDSLIQQYSDLPVSQRDTSSAIHDDSITIMSQSLDYSEIDQKIQEHEDRQVELQRYIKLLLGRSPSSTPSGTDAGPTHSVNITNGSTPDTVVKQQKRHVAFSDTDTVHDTSDSVYPQTNTVCADSAPLSPENINDLSELLNQYGRHQGDGAVQPNVGDLVTYLKHTQSSSEYDTSTGSRHTNGTKDSEIPASQAKRNLNATFKQLPKKSSAKPVTASAPVTKATSPSRQRKAESATKHTSAGKVSPPSGNKKKQIPGITGKAAKTNKIWK